MMPASANGKDDLLRKLRELQIKLGMAELENLMLQQEVATRQKFIALREQVATVIGTLENAQLAAIADQLDRLGPELNAGIAKMRHELTTSNNAIAIVNTVSAVLRLAERVAALV